MEPWCFDSIHNSSFHEMGIGEMIRKQFPQNSTTKVFDDNASVGNIVNPTLVTSNAVSKDEESSSKNSSSVMDSNSRESSLIDLKLGGLGDKPQSNSTSAVNVLSSAESSTPPKRARVTSSSSQPVYCQVYGCQKDLSSAKDYHKRHRVCDVHSKTSKVIVNGVEKRFCQQCSRFHLLGEFDDGKRSCRKRLAGHNERRRKPQVGFSSRSGRSFHSHTGSNFQIQGFTPTSSSYVCQDILLRTASHEGKYGSNDWVKHVKVENVTDNAQEPAYDCIYGQLQPKSNFPSFKSEKHFSFSDNATSTNTKSVFGDNVTQYMPQTVSLRNGDLTLLDAASTIDGLPRTLESGCALSLLSSQPQNSSGHSSQMVEPEVQPLVIPSSSPHYCMNKASEKFFEVQNRNALHGVNSDFGNAIHHSSAFMNVKGRLSCEAENTIDLLQLSSQLQRVEYHRQPEPLEQETEGSSCLRMT